MNEDFPDPEPMRCGDCGTLLDGFECPACRVATRERAGKRRDVWRWRGARLERLAYKMHPTPRQAARMAQLWSYHTAIEMWDGRGWDATAWSGSTDTRTYRTTEPPGFFLPDPKTMTAEVREKIVEAVKAMIEATPKSTRYVHTFACDACVRRCTMETITLDPELTSLGMRCPFSDPPFISLWRKVDGVHALTP